MLVKRKDAVVMKDQKPRNGVGTIDCFRYLDDHEITNSLKGFYQNELTVGSSIGFHKHIDDEEIYYILEGKGTIDDNGEEKSVEPGDLIYTASNKGHALKNTGDTPLKFIAFLVSVCEKH